VLFLSYPLASRNRDLLQVYDYLITFDDEITYVWSSKWNVGKILFLLVRYPVFLDIVVVKVASRSSGHLGGTDC
jgi:hypothetical protein